MVPQQVLIPCAISQPEQEFIEGEPLCVRGSVSVENEVCYVDYVSRSILDGHRLSGLFDLEKIILYPQALLFGFFLQAV